MDGKEPLLLPEAQVIEGRGLSLQQVYTVLGDVFPAAVPVQYSSILSPELWGIFQAMDKVTVRQHVKLLPKACLSCPPCAPQENTYSVYAGFSQRSELEILRVDEVSDDWNRCCCKPYHPLRLEVRQYIPVPGDNVQSDYDHLNADARRDFQRLTGRDRQSALKNMYQQQPVLLSMVRDGGQRCCRLPCRCLNCFVCMECCQDNLHIYAGKIADEEGKERGLANNLPENRLIGSVIQPIFGGGLTPTLHLRAGQTDFEEPFGKIEGPCLFGGWSEMCFTFNFFTSYYKSESKTGDIALIKKKKPSSFGAALTQLTSDADVYSIEFHPNAQTLTAEQKITVFTGQLLADYMLFDGNTEKFSQDENNCYCYLCYCSVFGKMCTCTITIPTKQN